MSRLTAPTASAAPVSNVVELVASPGWVKAHGAPRIAWSDAPRRPHEAPHVPRREQMSPMHTAFTLLLGLVAVALVAATTFLWPVVQHWLVRP